MAETKRFLLAYHGGKMPADPAEAKRLVAAWREWLGAMGDRLVDDGNPVRAARTVTARGVTDGGGSNPVTGYSIIDAEDIDHAVSIVKSCPLLRSAAGAVEVSELYKPK